MPNTPNRPTFTHVQPGDTVMRMLGGTIPMRLKVTEVEDGVIYCGPRGQGWSFDAATGAEIDHDLQWGPQYGITGSYLVSPDPSTT